MTREDLLSLADRIEKAERPDRELDLEIQLSKSPGELPILMANRRGFDGLEGTAWELREGAVLYETRNSSGNCWANGGIPVPRYTASLDAAMTLVPGYCLFTTRTLWDGDRMAGFASVSQYEEATVGEHFRRYWIDEHQSNAATPALSICAAALRAQASSLKENDSAAD